MTTPWPGVPFLDAVEDATGGHRKVKQRDYLPEGRLAVVDQGAQLIGGYTDDSTVRSQVPLPAIVFGDHTRCVKYVDFPFAVGADGVKVLRPRGGLEPRFLYHFLRSVQLQDGGYARHFKYLKAVEVPVPPVEDQRRIAAILDAADDLRAKRQEALAKLDTLTQAIFLDMFGDPFSPETEAASLSELAEIVMGQSPPGESYNEGGEGVPLLNGPTEFGARTPTAVQWTSAPTRMSEPGDILFCVRGATAGRLNWSDRQYCLGRGLAAIRVPASRREFVYRVLDAYYPRFQAAGVGSTFINISKKELHAVPVPVASSEDTEDYERHQRHVNDLKTTMLVASQAQDALLTSLQQRAFAGEL